MKKTGIFNGWDFHYLKKIFRIMRIVVFLVLTAVFQSFAYQSYSQKTKLSLDLSGARLVDVLDEIENKTEFFFLFNEKLVETNRKVNISVKNCKIEESPGVVCRYGCGVYHHRPKNYPAPAF